jgi:hypothetical protein
MEVAHVPVAGLIFFWCGCGLSFGWWDFDPNRGKLGTQIPVPSLLDGALRSSHPPNKERGHCAWGELWLLRAYACALVVAYLFGSLISLVRLSLWFDYLFGYLRGLAVAVLPVVVRFDVARGTRGYRCTG